MGKNANFVSHKKSKLIVDGKPKLPSAGSLVEGEIAINFAENVETLSIKNESGTVVTFSSDNYYSEQKLGSGFTGENSAVTVTDAILWERGEGEGSIKVKHSSVNASGVFSYAEGLGTQAIGDFSHAEGVGSQAIGNKSHTEGDTTTASGYCSHSEGFNTKAIGDYSHAEGNGAIASGTSSHAEGSSTTASGSFSHAEGGGSKALGNLSHAEGGGSQALGDLSHAEGSGSQALGSLSHAEGGGTKASGNQSHAEGASTVASGTSSHAEGSSTTASGNSSHAEGSGVTANGDYSHAEGSYTTASGNSSHAEGSNTRASGNQSHAEGGNTTANGDYSHAEGNSTVANNFSEHANGRYNVSSSASTTFGDSGNTLFSVGNGTDNNSRHNAFEIRQNGDIYIVKNGTDVKLQDEIGNVSIEIDQVLDDSTSASTNPIATHAVYEVIAADELVWANAYVTLSGSVAGKFDASAFTAYSGAVDTAIGNKLNTADFNTYSGTVDTQIGNKLDISAFTAYSGVVDTTIGNKLDTADFNTYSGTVDTQIGIKLDTSAFTAYSGVVDTTISGKLNTADFNTYSGTVDTQIGNKLDTSAFTAYSGVVDTTIGNKLNTADFNVYSGTVDSELSTKLDSSDIANFFDVVKYEDSGTSKVINFYNGNTLKATINADDFIVDGMISGVTLESKSGTTYLVINWNTDASGQTTELNIGDIFEADNYYDKNSIDSIVGTGFTVSSITEVIESNERVIAASLNDLYSTKLDTSAFTSYSGAVDTAISNKLDTADFNTYSGAVDTAIGNKLNTADFNTYSGAIDTVIDTKAAQSDLEELSGTVSGHTVEITDLSGQAQTVAAALVYLNNTCTGLDNRVTTVENKNLTSGDVITALGYAPTNVVYTAVTVTADLNNQTCPVVLSYNGQQCNVLYINDSTAHNVVISTTYKTPDGEPITLELAANGYGEVNYMYYDGDIYVKAS